MASSIHFECQALTYSQAVQRQEDKYQELLRSGAIQTTSFPSSQWNILILVAALCVVPACQPSLRFPIRYSAYALIVATSIWSLLYHRKPGIPGSMVVGLNAFMCTVFATNFLILRDPCDIRRKSTVGVLIKEKSDRTIVNLEREPVPQSFFRRLFWAIDLIARLRATKWSWAPARSGSAFGKESQDSLKFCKHQLYLFSVSYIALDIIKCVMIADPYFLGYNCPAPEHVALLPWLVLHLYRLFITVAGITAAIQYEYSGWALLQVGLIGPNILGLNGTPCMYPPLYGSIEAIFRRGLRGFWGETWHQTFRAHFASIGEAVASVCVPQSGTKAARRTRNAVRLVVVFMTSGGLHACAAYALLGTTQPLNAFLCFALQPVGIALQELGSRVVRWQFPGLTRSISLARWTRFAFVVVWLRATFTPLSNAFATGGTWLFEPVPFSPVRGLGFSKQDKRWFPVVGMP